MLQDDFMLLVTMREHASPHFYPQREDVDMLRIRAPTSVVTCEARRLLDAVLRV